MNTTRRGLILAGGALATPWSGWGARAQAGSLLRIGLASEPTTLDPQFYNLTPNTEASGYVFDQLVQVDPEGRLVPGLATSWRLLNPTTWEFPLREGVTFHDGTAFDVEDVLASFARVPTVQNSPSNFVKYLSKIAKAEAVSPHLLRITTVAPYPNLPSDLSQIFIIPRRFVGASTADFNSGAAMIGTGPCRIVEWIPGDRQVYARNDAAWGQKCPWPRVQLQLIGRTAARTAALLSRSVDLINQVSPEDIETLGRNADIRLRSVPEPRLMYLSLDVVREQSPFVRDREGRVLDRNPLRDRRVRQALSMALDRAAFASRVMAGQAVPAGDLMPPGSFGTTPDARPDAFDPAAARRLLSEAGWPDGFVLTLHGPNDRYVNDARVVQAAAQYFSRIGIRTEVETLPKSIYFSRLANNDFSAFLVGTSPAFGVGALGMLTYVLTTRDPKAALGAGNWTHHSNPELDKLVHAAITTMDDGERESLTRRAGRIAMHERTILPLFFGFNTWAVRKPFDYVPRADGCTLATATTASS